MGIFSEEYSFLYNEESFFNQVSSLVDKAKSSILFCKYETKGLKFSMEDKWRDTQWAGYGYQ